MRDRPKEYVDRFRQFVGFQQESEAAPIPVAIWQDGRGISSREAAPLATFAVADGGPAAGNHTMYVWTPRTPSRELRVRICWLRLGRETATAIVGVRIGTATATAASAAVAELGDVTGAALTIAQITNANLPLTVVNFFAETDLPEFAYPEYSLEATIPPNQVMEIISRTQDDTLNASGCYYTLPVV